MGRGFESFQPRHTTRSITVDSKREYQYPAKFEPSEEGGFVVTFRDIPEAITQGDSEEEAMSMAEDALASSLEFYFEDSRAVPEPSDPYDGERMVAVSAEVYEKIRLHNSSL